MYFIMIEVGNLDADVGATFLFWMMAKVDSLDANLEGYIRLFFYNGIGGSLDASVGCHYKLFS